MKWVKTSLTYSIGNKQVLSISDRKSTYCMGSIQGIFMLKAAKISLDLQYIYIILIEIKVE